MENASGGNLSALVDIQGGEFGWLAGSYNQMMRRLKSSMDVNRGLIEQIGGFNEELKAKIASATRELAAKNEQLETANERLFLLQGRLTTLEKLATLGQISAVIAHELGTPLNAISGHLQLLLQDPATDRAAADRLRVIDAQVDRLTSIVRDVLKAMQVPAPRLRPVDLRVVSREVVDLFAPVASKRGVGIELAADRELPPVQADADQLQQVFMNLFTNSMDAMRGGGRLRVTVAPAAGPEGVPGPGPWVRVDVADTGQGMDEETVKHAFEPFYTTKRVEPQPGLGARVGLGLSICRQIVLNHRGEIVVRSRKGEGTTFTLFLPVGAGAPA
jgi:signal transduction histidine kinase